MMGLHQNYPITWGAEKMEGLTLDLGLDGMFSPLPTELNPVGTKESDPLPSWRYFGHSQTQPHIIDLDDDDDDDNDNPCALLQSSTNSGEAEQKPDMFELSLSYPPQTPCRQQQQQLQQLINMKVERETVEPPNLNAEMPSLPEDNLASQSNFGFNCWRRTTELPPCKELHLYGNVGDENAEDFMNDDAITDFQDFKSDRRALGGMQTAAAQQHPETIILTDDDSDDEFLLEERYPSLKDRSISPPLSGGSSRGSQERGLTSIPQSLPLRQIKQHVRSYRSDKDYNSSVTPSPSDVPEITWEQQYGPKNLEADERNHEVDEQGKQPNPKRVRAHDDHDSLSSDLFDASHLIRQNDAKRARGSFGEDTFQAAYNVATTQSTVSNVQVPIQHPVLDVNQECLNVLEMPQDTAEAFKELMRLNRENEMENRCSVTSDVLHNDTPAPTATVSPPSRAADEMESRRSVVTDYQQIDSPPPATGDEASRSSDEIESRRSVSTSDFEQSDSPPLATLEQPVLAVGGPFDHPSESVSRSQCSHPLVYTQRASNRQSNADVVLYEPKPEPVEESWRENNMDGSVVHVKQEQLHYEPYYEPVPDRIAVRPVGESAVERCCADRNLIRTALDTFEQVRQQIIKDPSYGQPDLQAGGPEGPKGNGRRLRADLKAACLMRKKGYWLNNEVRPIGAVPGVAVGDRFRYRIEMAVIGLHRAVQAGIAVVPLEYSPYGAPVASSVVIGVADPYQDDNDMGDTVVYSGQGGLSGRTKEWQDQKLQRGNLAMNNSYALKLPVRLIRGHKELDSMTGILYSYDGLYQIVDMKYVPGVNGKKVYKFTMHRLPGQAPIFTSYPAPLGSQLPGAGEPTQTAVHWSETSDAKPLYLEKR